MRIHATRVLTGDAQAREPGTILRADAHGIEVACGSGVLVIDELQLDGKRRVTAQQFCAGHPSLAGGTLVSRITEQ